MFEKSKLPAMTMTGLRKLGLIIGAVLIAIGLLALIDGGSVTVFLLGAFAVAGLLAWEYFATRRMASNVQGFMATSPQSDTLAEQIIAVLAIVAGVFGREIPETLPQLITMGVAFGIAAIAFWRDFVKTKVIA